jgi:polysaccharide biosynthesis/export protein
MRFQSRLGRVAVTLALSGYVFGAYAQQVPREQAPAPPVGGPNVAASAQARRLPEYVLGPNDELSIMSVEATEISNKVIRVSTAGDITLPMVGRIHAAGMTVQQLEQELVERLKVYIKQPDVAVSVTQFKSQPVSVIGAVGAPGVVQLEGRKTLIEVLSLAGGIRDDASSRIRITRFREWGPIPLPSVDTDPSAPYSVAIINIRSIVDASHPEQNIQILPFDVISVPRAEIVYALGQVYKPGGYALDKERETISVLQLLALANGQTPTAALKAAKIIRPVPGASREELPIDLRALLDGKIKDFMLKPDDILYVPDSYAKGTLRRTLDTFIGATAGMAIYRIP